jgi:O-acetyl-ADP-ribose deacetylase (regulator of RNase III)
MKNRIEIHKGDITKLKVDAIVNAANTSLLGGGGVDGAIHRTAGPELLEFNKKLGGCKTGEAKLSPGFNLPAKFIIHTVGPVWNGGKNNEENLLANCYRNSIKLAIENKIRTIAFPAISTGVYHFPLERATKIAITEVKKFLENNESIEKVIFVCFDEETFEVYKKILNEYFYLRNIIAAPTTATKAPTIAFQSSFSLK